MMSTGLFLLAVLLLGAAVMLRRRLGHVGLLLLLAAVAAVLAVWLAAFGSYDLRKVIGTLLMPAGLVWLGLIGFAVWLTRRRAGVAVLAVWLLVAGYAAAGSSLVGRVLLETLQRPFVNVDPFVGPPLEAVVVLGGGLGRGPFGRPVLGAAGDRMVLGPRLLACGRTALLVTSGPVVEVGGERVSGPELTAALWRELGVPAAAILTVAGPRTTGEEMDAIAELVRQRGWSRLGVVTSGYHMRRALRLARRRGLDPTPLPADLIATDAYFEPRQLLPSGGGFEAVHKGCWELVGMVATR